MDSRLVLRCAEAVNPLPFLFVQLKREKAIRWNMPRRRTPSTGSFATSKLLLGNQTAPGEYCGVWMVPSRSIPRHLEMPVPTPHQMCLDKFSTCGILCSCEIGSCFSLYLVGGFFIL